MAIIGTVAANCTKNPPTSSVSPRKVGRSPCLGRLRVAHEWHVDMERQADAATFSKLIGAIVVLPVRQQNSVAARVSAHQQHA